MTDEQAWRCAMAVTIIGCIIGDLFIMAAGSFYIEIISLILFFVGASCKPKK